MQSGGRGRIGGGDRGQKGGGKSDGLAGGCDPAGDVRKVEGVSAGAAISGATRGQPGSVVELPGCAGTNGTAPVPVYEPNTETPRLDPSGKPMYVEVHVEFDEAQLKRVAQIANGHFYRAADMKSMQDIFSEIDKLEKSTVQYKKYEDHTDLFPMFVSTGVLLLGLELLLSHTAWRSLP